MYGRSEKHVNLESIQLDKVELFCYLGDKICPGGGCELVTIARTRAAWGKFRELLPLLTFTTISLARRGNLCDSCVRGALLHTSECCPLEREEVQRLLRNEQAISSWMLKIKTEENVNLSKMYGRLNLTIKAEVKSSKMVWTCKKN